MTEYEEMEVAVVEFKDALEQIRFRMGAYQLTVEELAGEPQGSPLLHLRVSRR